MTMTKGFTQKDHAFISSRCRSIGRLDEFGVEDKQLRQQLKQHAKGQALAHPVGEKRLVVCKQQRELLDEFFVLVAPPVPHGEEAVLELLAAMPTIVHRWDQRTPRSDQVPDILPAVGNGVLAAAGSTIQSEALLDEGNDEVGGLGENAEGKAVEHIYVSVVSEPVQFELRPGLDEVNEAPEVHHKPRPVACSPFHIPCDGFAALEIVQQLVGQHGYLPRVLVAPRRHAAARVRSVQEGEPPPSPPSTRLEEATMAPVLHHTQHVRHFHSIELE